MVDALISVDDLGYSYCGRQHLFHGVSFALHAGERLAVLGDNGVGKTTLLSLLVGLRKARSGSITAFGTRCESEAEFVAVRKRVGYVFQDPDDQLFCPTVLEDLCFGPINLGMSEAEAVDVSRAMLEQLGIASLADKVSFQLSGGQKRIVTLASVLVMQPDVLLLDEPTNALDAHARERLLSTLLELPQAMIVVSHDKDFVESLATRSCTLQPAGLMAPLRPVVA